MQGSTNTYIVPAIPRYQVSRPASIKLNVCANPESNLVGQKLLTVSNQLGVQSLRLPAERSKIFQDIPMSSNFVLLSHGDPVIWLDVYSRLA
jgi:hypothetical protein